MRAWWTLITRKRFEVRYRLIHPVKKYTIANMSVSRHKFLWQAKRKISRLELFNRVQYIDFYIVDRERATSWQKT